MTNIQEYNPYVAKGKMIESEIQSLSITTFIDLENADTLLKKTQKLKREIEEKRVEIVKPVNDQVKIINSMAKEILIPIEQSELVLKNKILEWNRQQEAIRAEKENKVKEKLALVTGCKSFAEIEALGIEIDDPRIATAIETQKIEIQRAITAETERVAREEEEKRLAEIRKGQSEEQAKLEAEKIALERERRELEAEKQKIEDQKRQDELAKKEEQQTKLNSIAETSAKPKGIRKQIKFEVTDPTLVPHTLCSPDEKKIREFVKSGVKEIPGVRVREEDAVR